MANLEKKDSFCTLYVLPSVKSAKYACVTICIESPNCNWFVLNKLRNNEKCTCPELANGSECTTLMWALFKNFESKCLVNMKMEKVSAVNCSSYDIQDSTFVISLVVNPSMTNVTKAIKNFIKSSFNLTKLYQTYAEGIILLNGKPNRDNFNHVASMCNNSLKKVHLIVSGKTDKLLDDKCKELSKMASQLIGATIADTEKGSAPESDKRDRKPTDANSKKYKSNYEAAKVFNYLVSKKGNVFKLNTDTIIDHTNKLNFDSLDMTKVNDWFKKVYVSYQDADNAIKTFMLSKCQISHKSL